MTYNKRIKKRKKGNQIFLLAWHNLFRSKKKTILVILSLTISITIFIGVILNVENFDINDHLASRIGSDYLIGDARYFGSSLDKGSVPEFLLEDLKGEVHPLYKSEGKWILDEILKNTMMDSIEVKDPTSYAQSILKEGYLSAERYSADALILEHLSKYLVEGEIPDQLEDDEIIVEDRFFGINGHGQVPIEIGDIITIDDNKYKVIALVRYLPLYLYDQSFTEGTIQTYVNEQAGDIISIMVNGSLDEDYIKDLYPTIEVKSRQDYIEDLKDYILMIRVVGFSLSGLLALIGILNFINMMNTSIVVRKREFAILQSIGMTSKQLKSMLLYEGGYILLLASILSFTLSLVLSIIQTGHFELSFFLPLSGMLAMIMIVMAIIPLLAYREMMKESIIERLNTIE